ncbi:unnamed protein product [Bursaphelenchus xylophilus]|uniref:Serine/threonine-protein phosphatase n=1 Tax=Bursaphelenchus xylophilus TaxID=6326 RepID=A0A1I7S3L4_BURXY|nr:unnamed protein product [Bursaphelenchus xylophilus]CAG9116390.1 unnamed protein product [Bursaphelenchus xylophilus]
MSKNTAEGDDKVGEKVEHKKDIKPPFLPDLNEKETKADIQKRLQGYANIIRSLKGEKKERLTGNPITLQMALEITLRGRERFMTEPPIVSTSGGICVVGDLHSNLMELLTLLDKLGIPPFQRLLFLGDYVDRGDFGVEVVCLLTIYKILYPKHIYLLRGNHETRAMNIFYGFLNECKRKYGRRRGRLMYTYFGHMFNVLPIAAVIGGRIFCAHGGISRALRNVTQLKKIARPYDVADFGILCDLVWSDPVGSSIDFALSPRKIGTVFGTNGLKEFFENTGMDLLIRAHQSVPEGTELTLGGSLTVFSVPNYMDDNNKGGVAYVDNDLNVRCYRFKSTKDQ